MSAEGRTGSWVVRLGATLLCLGLLPSAEATGAAVTDGSTCGLPFLLDASRAADSQLQCLQQMEADGRLRKLSRRDIDRVSSALYPRKGTRGDSADADITLLLVRELKRRRPGDASRDDSVFGALMLAGRVEEAERLPYAQSLRIRREPLAQSPPEGWARYWTVVEKPLRLVEGSVDLRVGRHVVVYTSPGCGFCQQAARAIAADPLLDSVFKAHSLWIHVPDSNYGPDFFLKEWPQEEYSFPTRVIFDRAGWPVRRIPATPVFFFIRDGQVVAETLGWYRDSLSKMARQLAELGFLSP